jgi:predicted lipoprotein with Yx(FWY)xxD motif
MTATETTTATASTAGATVMVFESPTLGQILTDDKGMTLYIFDKDVKDKSNCSGGCLKNWPAFMVKEEDAKVTGDGVTATFGVIERDDGTYQVTANGMPLYYYVKDQNPHDTTGQAVGDVWWVVGPDGNKITKQ